jgi:3-hydroxy-D-aspartate aldolase
MDLYRPLPGTRIEDLDTPCLLIDLDALEHNFQQIAEMYRDSTCKMRAHIKNLKSPLLAHMQIRAGGTVGGVCTAKVAEAEVMMEGGIDDIFIANQVVGRDKIERLCALAKHANLKVAIDDPRNLQELSALAHAHGVTIGVVIEVDTSMHRAGVRQIAQGVHLAKLASTLPGIAFKGVMSHQTVPGRPDKETRLIEGRRFIQMCLDVKEAIEDAGIAVAVVSTGESWTYDVARDIPGVTEVEGGTYALMSHTYDYMRDFRIAAMILGTIISTPRPGVAIGDVGTRALGSPGGVLPRVEDMPGVSVEALHAEHIVLHTDGTTPVAVGDRFLLSSGQQDIMVNRWYQYIAVRRCLVEAVFDIPARGCHH